MRPVLFHIVGLLVTLGLYCAIVPQARHELLSDASLGDKMTGVGMRAVGVYMCFLFVYYAVFRSRDATSMPAEGAYGGYAEPEEEDQPADESECSK